MRGLRDLTFSLPIAVLACGAAAEKLHLTWLWHLEQPIYWPDANGTRYERAWQSIQRRDGGAAHPANDLRAIFGLDDRVAAYQWRPRDCVNAIRWSAEAGAQVTLSGGLVENIQSFAEAGGQLGYGTNWYGSWREARNWYTAAAGTNVPRMDVVIRHVFRNSLLPLITMFVGIFPAMLGGSVVVERIFSVPGMGTLILEAIDLRDREIILANTFMIACVNLLALLLADILYAMADPRVSYE